MKKMWDSNFKLHKVLLERYLVHQPVADSTLLVAALSGRTTDQWPPKPEVCAVCIFAENVRQPLKEIKQKFREDWNNEAPMR